MLDIKKWSLGLLGVTMISVASHAQDNTKFDLQALDKNHSCTSYLQQTIAQKTLDWFDAFKADDIKTQMDLLAPDVYLFHSALAQVALDIEAAIAAGVQLPYPYNHLPFTSGPIRKDQYVGAISIIALGNIISQHRDIPVAVDCLGEGSVAVTVDFNGVQVTRDKNGYVLYKAPYAAPVMKMLIFDEDTLLIKRYYSDFNPAVSAAAKQSLKDQATSGQAPLPADESIRATYDEIVEKYQDAMGLEAK